MSKPYDSIVYIGRFQPFHNGHLSCIERAFELANHVIVIVGSANEPRTFKNPFTLRERELMIMKSAWSFTGLTKTLNVVGLENSAYNDAVWVSNIQSIVG